MARDVEPGKEPTIAADRVAATASWLAVLAGLVALWLLALLAPAPTFDGPALITLTVTPSTVMPEDVDRVRPGPVDVLTPVGPFGGGR